MLGFEDLFFTSAPVKESVMVMFIRHFCGSCQAYIQTLSKAIPSPDNLPCGWERVHCM
ncbi:hypothetical protein V1506DRAFT_544114 [Lipomyces tetrasporus]